jgi:hypothetical protein
MIHREASDDPVVLLEVAREVSEFLREANVPVSRFLRELQRVHRQRPRRRLERPVRRRPGA